LYEYYKEFNSKTNNNTIIHTKFSIAFLILFNLQIEHFQHYCMLFIPDPEPDVMP